MNKKKKETLWGCVFLRNNMKLTGWRAPHLLVDSLWSWKHFWLLALQRVRVGPLIWSGLFLMKPLHTFSAGHYSGPTVHNESCWSIAVTCDDSEAPPTKLSGLKSWSNINRTLWGSLWPKAPKRDKIIMSQLVFTALPLKHQEQKWNWLENPASAQPGTEGIIVLIVLILCRTPPLIPPIIVHPLPFCFCVVLLVRSHQCPSFSCSDWMLTLWISRTYSWRFSSSTENHNEILTPWKPNSLNYVALLNPVRIYRNWSVYLSFSCLCLLCTVLSPLGNIALCVKKIIFKCFD